MTPFGTLCLLSDMSRVVMATELMFQGRFFSGGYGTQHQHLEVLEERTPSRHQLYLIYPPMAYQTWFMYTDNCLDSRDQDFQKIKENLNSDMAALCRWLWQELETETKYVKDCQSASTYTGLRANLSLTTWVFWMVSGWHAIQSQCQTVSRGHPRLHTFMQISH